MSKSQSAMRKFHARLMVRCYDYVACGCLDVSDRGNGEYAVVYNPHIMGECVISVSLGDVAICGSPFYGVVGTDTLDPSRSTASGDGLISAIAGEMATFIVQARDQFGAPRPCGGDRCEVKAPNDLSGTALL